MLRRSWERISLFVEVADEIEGPLLARALKALDFHPPKDRTRRTRSPVLLQPPVHLVHREKPVELRAYPFGVLEVSLQRSLPSFLPQLHALLLSDIPPEAYQSLHRALESVLEAGGGALKGHGSGEEELYRFVVLVPRKGYPVRNLQERLPLTAWLLGEEEAFSREIQEAVHRSAFSYTAYDLLLIGWDRTVLVDPWEETQVLDVVAYALAQDLELSTFDRYLEEEMDRVHEVLRGRRGSRKEIRELREWALDFLEAVDRVRGGIKLTEDPYYARVYERALRIFGVPQVEASLQARMGYLERLLEVLESEERDRRLEMVEWGIFLLILLEILLWVSGFD